MSRFNDDDNGDLQSILAQGRWMGRCKAVLNGRPGLAGLKSLEVALLALPHKQLIEGALCDGTGVCANGAWLYRHLVDVEGMTPKVAWRKLQSHDHQVDRFYEDDMLAQTIRLAKEYLGVTATLAEMVAWENDDGAGWGLSPSGDITVRARRYTRMLAWVQKHIREHPLNQPGK